MTEILTIYDTSAQAPAIRFELPWPAKVLNPNRSGGAHWAVKGRAVRDARQYAMATCRNEASARRFTVPAGARVDIQLLGVPATRRNRDLDNFLASCKAYLDGISDALGVNDVRFNPSAAFCLPGKPAKVIVTVRAVM